MLTWITPPSCVWWAAAEALHKQSLIYFWYIPDTFYYLVFLTGADKKSNPPLQPIAQCCSSPGCSLWPALEQWLGATVTQRESPSLGQSIAKLRHETTMRCSTLLWEPEGKLRDGPKKHHISWGKSAHTSLRREFLCQWPGGGESKGRLELRADCRSLGFHQQFLMGTVRLMKHFWAFKKAGVPPSAEAMLWDRADCTSPTNKMVFRLSFQVR